MNQNTLSQNIFYAMPMLSLSFLVTGPMAVMPGLYVKYFGLSIGAMALAKLLARLFDGITDPLVGYVSDRYQQRYGTRKPLIIAGGILLLLSGAMLYIPYGWDAQQSQSISFSYFLFLYLAFTLSWTLMQVPILAWGADISSDIKGRSQRFSFFSIAGSAASAMFFAIPFFPVFESTEVTPETLKVVVYMSVVLMPLCLFVCMRWVPDPPRYPRLLRRQVTEDVQVISKWHRFKKVARLIIANRPLLVFYLAFGLAGLGYSMSTGLTFFFVDNYLGVPEKLSYVFMVSFGVSVPASWFWGVLAQKIGARSTWLIGLSLCAIGLLGIVFLEPGASTFWLYLVCNVLMGGGYASCFVVGYMVLSNIVDYGKWKFGQDCSGLYFASASTMIKFNTAVGVAIGLLLADWLGFDPAATVMSTASRAALFIPYSVLPTILLIFAAIVVSRIPLDTRQHADICKRLDAEVLEAVAPIGKYKKACLT